AVKFSEPGSAIRLGSVVVGSVFRLWVEDEGRGIATEDLARIFERFERAGSRGVEGSGLGLAIVSAIAAAHGGRMDVSSEPGVGSNFAVEIPVDLGHPGTADEGEEG